VDRQTMVWPVASIPMVLPGSAPGARPFDKAPPQYHRLTALVVLCVLAVAPIGRSLAG
jgi:hypothetical protein